MSSLLATAACGDSTHSAAEDGGRGLDATVPQDGSGGPVDAGCVPVAQVQTDCPYSGTSADQCNTEIINACTSAQAIYNTFKPPLLNPDGTLPPLPD